jgi:peroxiredoxin/outer membrane biosynthesis protein TonB
MKFPSLLLLSAFAIGSLQAADPLPGHSVHGEAFNEGPRQEAHFMAGTGKVNFPVTTPKPLAQRFFNQGIGQLHGFWFFEAERSFRQVAKLDPDCAMAYWGMAMANLNNEKRARGFIGKAADRKAKAHPHELLWINMLESYLKEDKRDDNKRELDAIRDLELIVQTYPDNIEAKAFLAWKIWHGKNEASISSPMAVQAILDQVFAVDPNHPAHHYAIHLWDGFKPEQGLKSAAAGGPSAPGIAHMWHMPGHIYSKLRRFDDAAWQQEASTRVDHAYMIENFVQPDQIHNYAHNEEWLIRTFNELGQAQKAITLASDLIAHPQHPANNTLDKGGCSASYGRTRLLDTLIKWELWPLLLASCSENSLLIPIVPQPSHESARLKAIGLAHFAQESPTELAKTIDRLVALDKSEAAKAQKAPAPKPTEEVRKAEPVKSLASATPPTDSKKTADTSKKPSKEKPKTRPSETAIKELQLLESILKKAPEAAKRLSEAKDLDKTLVAKSWLLLGDLPKAIAATVNLPQDLAGLITKADILDHCKKPEEAKKAFESAQKLAFNMDPDLPAAVTLKRLANKFNAKSWQGSPPKRTDLGSRPPLDELGPFLWTPPIAPEWAASDLEGHPIVGGVQPGKPQLLVFYLGSECTHCVDQLNTLSKHLDAFATQGIAVQAISPQLPPDAVKVRPKLTNLKDITQLHLLSDPHFIAFKSFRAFDDFENDALHATVLLDADNRIRWIDISYQPFMDIPFLLKESKRLLAIEP